MRHLSPAASIFLIACLAGCVSNGPITTPSAGLAPAGVDPGASGGYSDAGSFGPGPYGDPYFGDDGFDDGFGEGFGDIGF